MKKGLSFLVLLSITLFTGEKNLIPGHLSNELILAVEDNNILEVERLLAEDADYDYQNENSETALILASIYNFPEIAELLINSWSCRIIFLI